MLLILQIAIGVFIGYWCYTLTVAYSSYLISKRQNKKLLTAVQKLKDTMAKYDVDLEVTKDENKDSEISKYKRGLH